VADFFISYSGADRERAEWIAWELEQAGYSVIIQAWDFKPGSHFVIEMKKAADECERTIAVLSSNYIGAVYTHPEWAAAFVRDPTGEKGLLIPVRVEPCEVPHLLKPLIYIDLVGKTEAAARDELLSGVKRSRRKPEKKPQFSSPVNEAKPSEGALSAIWNVPHLRNSNFTGRAQLLVDLHSALASGKSAAVTQAIGGLGGVGKTQLAIEYAYRFASDYSLVWWVRAETAAIADNDYAKLAVKLSLPEKDLADQPKIVEAVREWLEHHADWLLILDNVESESDCDRFRPRSNTGHILITSRNQNWADAEVLPIHELPRPEAIAFLQKRSGRQDEKTANDLCDAVGDLPLALEQAGAYIRNTGSTITEYLSMFQSSPKGLLNPVAVTWRMSFERLQTENPAALDLLYLIAYLAPDNIPRDLVQSTAVTLIEFNKAVESLRRYSLIEASEGMISIHRLVQKVVRDLLVAQGKHQEWAERAIRLVNDAFPTDSDNYTNWPACSRLLPHAITLSGRAEELGIALDVTTRLLNQSALYLLGRAQSDEAEGIYRRALRLAEEMFGPDDGRVAPIVTAIGLILRTKGDLDGALHYAKLALRISENFYGPDHPSVARDTNNIGLILRDKGDLEEALQYMERAIRIDEKVYGPNHREVATDANNLGLILKAKGDLERAQHYAERALRIDEKADGPDHPEVGRDVNSIGTILEAKGDLNGALLHYERAVRILQNTFGLDHPYTKAVENNLRDLQAKIALDKPSVPPTE
jgi:tetratricopeptide (TPR) repeat protein